MHKTLQALAFGASLIATAAGAQTVATGSDRKSVV